MTVSTLKKLRNSRDKLVKDSRDLLERVEGEGRDFNAEEDAQWKKMNEDITALNNRVQRFMQVEENEKAIATVVDHGLGLGGSHVDNKSIGGDEPGMKADAAWNTLINAWSRGQMGVDAGISRQVLRNAGKICGVNHRVKNLTVPLAKGREYLNLRRQIIKNAAMSVGTAANGGYTIPIGFQPALETALLYFGPMLQVADIWRTPTGNAIHWPLVNDTGNTGVLLSEATTIGSSVIATWAEAIFNAYKFSSQLVQISAELIQDSYFDMPTELGTQLGMRLGRVLNTYFTTGLGSGSSQPQGIVVGATLGVTAASASAIAYDEVIDLEHSVGIAYRPNMAYMCADSTVQALRKIKDSYGRYLWQASANSGTPEMLNNKPLHVNQDMAAIATTNKSLIAGDFSKYKARLVGEVRARRLVERYADLDQEGYVSFIRADGKVLDAGTHPIKYLVHP